MHLLIEQFDRMQNEYKNTEMSTNVEPVVTMKRRTSRSYWNEDEVYSYEKV